MADRDLWRWVSGKYVESVAFYCSEVSLDGVEQILLNFLHVSIPSKVLSSKDSVVFPFTTRVVLAVRLVWTGLVPQNE